MPSSDLKKIAYCFKCCHIGKKNNTIKKLGIKIKTKIKFSKKNSKNSIFEKLNLHNLYFINEWKIKYMQLKGNFKNVWH